MELFPSLWALGRCGVGTAVRYGGAAAVRPISTTATARISDRIRAHKEAVLIAKPDDTKHWTKMVRAFAMSNPEGYAKGTNHYRAANRADEADGRVFACMMDHSFTDADQAAVLATMSDGWVGQSGNVYAGMINLKLVKADFDGADELWKRAAAEGLIGESAPRSRLDGLATRPEKSLIKARTSAIYRASRFGLVAAAQEIFDGAEAAGLARREDYEAMLWGCGDYAGQLVFWERMERAAVEGRWTPSIEAFNAILWNLQLEERREEMHQVMDRIAELDMVPNDRTLHVIQRAGERFLQLKMAAMDEVDSPPWVSRTIGSAPRRKVGL